MTILLRGGPEYYGMCFLRIFRQKSRSSQNITASSANFSLYTDSWCFKMVRQFFSPSIPAGFSIVSKCYGIKREFLPIHRQLMFQNGLAFFFSKYSGWFFDRFQMLRPKSRFFPKETAGRPLFQNLPLIAPRNQAILSTWKAVRKDH